MAVNSWVVFQDVDRWRIGMYSNEKPIILDVELPTESTPKSLAIAITNALQSSNYIGEGVLLAVNASLCLATSVTVESPSISHQHQTMMYQLEQSLPLAAEDMVGDFVWHGQTAFCTAMPFADEKIFVDALEEYGVCVQTISPTALLALQHHSKSLLHDKITQYVLWQDGESVELFQLTEGRPILWQHLPAEEILLKQHLQVLALSQTDRLPVVSYHLTPQLIKALEKVPDIELHTADDKTLAESALMTAAEILGGKETPWIELRRDALGSSDPYRAIRGTLRWVTCTAAAFLIALTIGFSCRAYSYDQQALQNQEQQVAIFRDSLPGQPIPAGIRSRLESEYAKLAGLKGEAAQLPQHGSAFKVLHDVLASLPDGTRYRFRELRFDQQRAMLDGEVRSHGDADIIAGGLRKQGFTVEPPRTQQLSGQGVSIRITAEINSKESTKSKGGT